MLKKFWLTADSLLKNGRSTQPDNIYRKSEDRDVRKFLARQLLDPICQARQVATA
jgi:hypothetical protein